VNGLRDDRLSAVHDESPCFPLIDQSRSAGVAGLEDTRAFHGCVSRYYVAHFADAAGD
jgi:hypothetical protein